MKEWKFTMAIIFAAVFFTACTKEKSFENGTSSGGNSLRASSTTEKPTYISGWEGGYTWNISDSASYKIYSHDAAIAQVSADVLTSGIVLVWIKNYLDYQGNRIDRIEKLPLHVLPPVGRPAYDNQWYYMPSVGNITVKFRSNKQLYAPGSYVPVPDGNVQFRYFVLSAADLAGAGYTQASVQQANYNELVTKFGAGN